MDFENVSTEFDNKEEESNFLFLKELWPDLFEMGNTAEGCLFNDPNNCIMKIGLMSETIVNKIYQYENIRIPEDNTQANMIRLLKRDFEMPYDIDRIFYSIRKARNEAAHLYLNDLNQAKNILELGYKLACWFMEVYGDWKFIAKPYHEPVQKEKTNFSEYLKEQNERIAELEKSVELIRTSALEKDKAQREEKAKETGDDIIAKMATDSDAVEMIIKDNQLKFEIDSNKLISQCLLQNGFKIINSIKLQRTDTDFDLNNKFIEITSNPAFALPYKREISFFYGLENAYKDIDLRLDLNYLASLTEKIDGYLEVKLTDGENVVENTIELVEISVLPFNFWQGSSILTESLASFVTPNHSEISKIIATAAEKLYELTGNPSFVGYQQTRQDVLNQAAAIYYAIKDLNAVYVEPPVSFERFGQRIRLVDEIYRTKQACCIDFSLLYASCLESVGLNPLIILEKKHAYVGVWLTHENFPDTVTDDPTQITKRFAEGVNDITILESTLMAYGSAANFNDAQMSAKSRILNEENFECFLDIKCCRLSKIKPLPLLIEKDGKFVIEHKDIVENSSVNPDNIVTVDIQGISEKELTKKEQWERKLLDLGLRNPLINLHLSRSIIPVLSYGGCTEVVKALLNGNLYDLRACPVQWPRDPVKDRFESFGKSEDTDAIQDILKKSITEKKLYTPFDDETLNLKLKNLYRNAKTSAEENGANTLYLAAGIMKWYEKSGDVAHYAPLALVPIELTKRSANMGYFLSYRSEDTQINISLLEKLRHDFDLDITGLEEVPEDENGPNILQILTVFRKGIMMQEGWDVFDLSLIGNFSFSQFVMWNDIHTRTEDLAKNKIVKSLLDGKLGWEAKSMEFDGEVDSEDTYLPIPVDGSQLFAIKEANKGQSFVLHGPPGTGKSQTITALISNALAHGKTVLFVAEKRAALEVVEKRLEDIGIGPFCLELHSNKAKKNQVLLQLQKILELIKRKNTNDYNDQLKNIKKQKDLLNEYVKELHVQRDCGYSIYELINMQKMFHILL